MTTFFRLVEAEGLPISYTKPWHQALVGELIKVSSLQKKNTDQIEAKARLHPRFSLSKIFDQFPAIRIPDGKGNIFKHHPSAAYSVNLIQGNDIGLMDALKPCFIQLLFNL